MKIAILSHCPYFDFAPPLLPLAQEHAMQEMIAWATILRGWARSQLGERGIQIAREQQAKSFELRCTVSLAKLWAAQGRTGPRSGSA